MDVAEWQTIAEMGTSLGTLALAFATFGSVRSANRAARVAEEALRVGLRPVLVPSRTEDRTEKVIWVDDYWAHLDGGGAIADVTADGIYLAISLRNVGNGIGVLRGWHTIAHRALFDEPPVQAEEFREQTRDLYIPAADVGFWHGAYRGEEMAAQAELAEQIKQRQPFTVDLLYGDHEGGQRTVTRISLRPRAEKDWMPTVGRHWNLDRADPR